MADVLTKIPDTNWVRLEIEPVQVSHDGDETLNFATVQSVVPGAHGLYYRDDGERKALLFDNNTGKVYPPPQGWDSVPIFIHLAHGSRHSHGTHFADYSKANESFEKNIAAVQKLFAAAGLGGRRSEKVYSTASKTRARSTSKKNQPRNQFDAQPENVNISEESEGRDSEKEKNDRQVEKLKNKYEEIKIRAKEFKSDLAAAQLKIKTLEKKLESVKESGYFEEDGEKFVHIDSDCYKSPDHDEEVNNLHNVIEELRDKLGLIETKNKDLSSKYAESQEYLKNAQDKVGYLEKQLNSETHDETKTTAYRSLEIKLGLAQAALRSAEIEKQNLQEANWITSERASKIEQENGYLKGITEQLKARADSSHVEKLLKDSEKRVWEINEEKSKLEWRLGELSQWWNDAKWKVGELESSVAFQRTLLDTANSKIQSLNDQSQSTQMTIPTDGFTISQGHKGNWNLANGSAQQFTGAIPSIPLVSALPFAGANPFIFGGANEGRNVTLTIANTDQEVYLTGSFINWKCTLKCEKLANGKKGVTVNLTRGRHEFRFMINGEWSTSTDYQQVPNGLGGQNNVIFVE
ncbi:unnamed protein product [Caenorhabditis nigoni]